MASQTERGRQRKEIFSTKLDLIGHTKFKGEINRSYQNLPRYKVTDKKGMSWQISSEKSIEELLAQDKHKGCTIVTTV